jgi:5'(3')-deoxyribonucleotidase
MKSPAAAPSLASSKPVLAVDIDDVLAYHVDLLTGHYKAAHGIQVSYEHAGHNLLTQLVASGLSEADAIASTEEFIQGPGFHINPIEGAVEAIARLKDSYKMVIISARPYSIKQQTQDWLESHFPKSFKTIEFVGSPKWGEGYQASKGNMLEELRVDILIDDRLDHCETAAGQGVKAIVFGDYLWNKSDELPSGVTRAANWPEVERLLLP